MFDPSKAIETQHCVGRFSGFFFLNFIGVYRFFICITYFFKTFFQILQFARMTGESNRLMLASLLLAVIIAIVTAKSVRIVEQSGKKCFLVEISTGEPFPSNFGREFKFKFRARQPKTANRVSNGPTASSGSSAIRARESRE